MENAVTTDSLSVSINGTRILTDVSATVPTGQIVGVIGPSGSGKTTMLRAILGLQRPTSGSVIVLGRPAGDRSMKASVGYATQSPSIYQDLTVRQNLQYFADLRDVVRADVSAVIESVELTDYEDRLVSRLSGGQVARVSLGVALIGRPKLLILDEPTVGLDPLLRLHLWAMFRKLSDNGTTIMLSSHAMDEADKCDRLMFLHQGRIMTSDTTANVLSSTHSASVEEAYLKLATEEV